MTFPQEINASASPEVQMNENFDSIKWAGVYSYNPLTSSGLIRGYNGGRWAGFSVSDSTHTFGASTTTYVAVDRSTGALNFSTSNSNYNNDDDYGRVETVVTGASTVTSVLDDRAGGIHGGGGSGGVGAGGTVTSVNVTQPAAGITASGGPITASGSITLALADDLAAVEGLSSTGIVRRTASNTWSAGTTVATAEITDDAVTYAKMQNVSATARVIGRKTSGAGDPEELSLSEVLDLVGSAAQGDILYRGATAWSRLPAGTSGNVLTTQGTGANPQWGSAGGLGTVTSVNVTAPAAGVTASGGPITGSGAITLALADDLAAVEGLASTGLVRRTASNTWSAGTTVATAEITDDAVTYAKMQNVSATARVIGRKTAGSGDPEELSLSDVLDLVGSAAQGDILYRGASTWTRLAAGTSGFALTSQGSGANPQWTNTKLQSFVAACSDESTAVSAGTSKVTFRMPYAFTVTEVRASLSVAQTSGSIFTVDINEAGTSILSTKLTIDNTEKTSTTAATAPVISDTSLADDAEITIDVDQIGDGTAKGLKVTIIGRPT